MNRKYATMEERLLANSVVDDRRWFHGTPCWVWIGQYTNTDYPAITIRWKSGPRKGKTRKVGAHRLSLQVFRGRRFTKRMVCRHQCNYKSCINPWHLAGGSVKTNNQDTVKSKRHGNAHRKLIETPEWQSSKTSQTADTDV